VEELKELQIETKEEEPWTKSWINIYVHGVSVLMNVRRRMKNLYGVINIYVHGVNVLMNVRIESEWMVNYKHLEIKNRIERINNLKWYWTRVCIFSTGNTIEVSNQTMVNFKEMEIKFVIEVM